MSLHSEFRVLTGLFGVVFALSACSSAPFPEIVEEDDYTTASSSESGFDVPVRKRTLKESSALTADNEHVAYEGQENAKKTAEGPEKAAPAKTKPVIVAEDLDVKSKPAKKEKDSLAALNDEKFKKELKAAEELPKPENTAPSVTYLAGTVYFNNGSSAVDASYNRQLREIVRVGKSQESNAERVRLCIEPYAQYRHCQPQDGQFPGFGRARRERCQRVAPRRNARVENQGRGFVGFKSGLSRSHA